ncbi:MAG: GGDEF domain-containing protein [Pseudolabrys sp.]|nr:GGDEF domain-containing protein [Pseudolabrys sp.]
MSLHGPLIVVAESPATALVAALGDAGAFPIVEAKWADAPTAFVSVKPSAVIIAEPGPPVSEASSRMLCLQIATVVGPIVPTIAFANEEFAAALPVALTADAGMPVARMIKRLQSAMRVRALHATVLRRIELFVANGGNMPLMPVGDALDDATVLVAGRGPLYPALSVAMGEQAKMVGALSVESAAKHLNERDIDGIVIGDGFSPRMIEAFLTVLAQDSRFHEIPIAVIGDTIPGFDDELPNIDFVGSDPSRLVSRMIPMVRMRAFESRLKRMLKSLEADGIFDPDTGLLTPESFWRDLNKSMTEAADRSQALSVARYTFDGALDARAQLDGARMASRVIRNIDFGCRDEDGSLLIAFTQTDLRGANVVARRLAAAIKTAMMQNGPQNRVTANVTLASQKNDDTLDSLMQRVMGSRMVAAE